MTQQNYSAELTKDILLSMYYIESGFGTEGCESDCFAKIVITTTEAEEKQADERYALREKSPEIDEEIETPDGRWAKRVYIFGDAGDGITLYARKSRT